LYFQQWCLLNGCPEQRDLATVVMTVARTNSKADRPFRRVNLGIGGVSDEVERVVSVYSPDRGWLYGAGRRGVLPE
jgi:hypothetical protein